MKKKGIVFTTSCISVLIIVGVILYNPYNGSQLPKNHWALYNCGQEVEGKIGVSGIDINAPEAWKITKGNPTTVVGMIDTGIDLTSPCISNRVFHNPNEEENGKDDDGNGYVDDVSGWDFYHNDDTIFDSKLEDYHGTYLSSIIVGEHKENGVWGIAPGVKLLSVKFQREREGNVNDAVKAIEYAHKMGARIINCSWNIGHYSQKLYDVIRKYKDTIFVCATGNLNENLDLDETYPASYNLENVIAVQAINNRGELYKYSGYGSANVDVAAPGEAIVAIAYGNQKNFFEGTSAATAYVTGVIALMKSVDGSLMPGEIKKIITTNSKRLKDLRGLSVSEGVIDAASCVKAAQYKTFGKENK